MTCHVTKEAWQTMKIQINMMILMEINGDRVVAKHTKDENQDKVMERKKHPSPKLLHGSLCINRGPITMARDKEMREMIYKLIKEVKTKIAVEADLDKSKSCNLVDLIQLLNEPH